MLAADRSRHGRCEVVVVSAREQQRIEIDTDPDEEMSFRTVTEWMGDDFTRWSGWELMSSTEDRDPTYHASGFAPYRLGGVVTRYTPVREIRALERRRLIHQWVDPQQGQMAEIVDEEWRSR